MLLLVSIVSAITASLTLDTYTPHTPKRLFLQHITRVSHTGEQSSVYAAASSDATPIDVVLNGMNLTAEEADGREWLVSSVSFICLVETSALSTGCLS